MKEELICTLCPLGCHLRVTHDGAEILTVQGNECKRGLRYADREVFHPERTVTTTVAIRGAEAGLLPVKTDIPVPRDRCADIIRKLGGVVMEAPVSTGDMILRDVLGTGSNVVATRSLAKSPDGGL